MKLWFSSIYCRVLGVRFVEFEMSDGTKWIESRTRKEILIQNHREKKVNRVVSQMMNNGIIFKTSITHKNPPIKTLRRVNSDRL